MSSAWTDDVPVGAGTWERADGSSVELPARPEQMDLLGRQVIQTTRSSCGLSVDAFVGGSR